MCNDEVEVILTGFRENVCKGCVSKGLEFIYVEVEVGHRLHYLNRQVRSTHRREVDTSGEHRPEQVGIGFTNKSFGKVNEENLLLIHHFTNIKTGVWLTNDVTNQRVARKLSDFILNCRQGISCEALCIFGKFISPIRLYSWIFTVVYYSISIRFISQHATH